MATLNNRLFIQITDLIISIKYTKTVWRERAFFIKKGVHDFFKPYILPKTPDSTDIEIEFIDNIATEIIFNKPGDKVFIGFYRELNKNKLITYYHISLSQFVAIMDIILRKHLFVSNGIMLHASSIIYRNKAIIFSGVSGVGKSTMLNILRKKYKAFGDDIIIIKKENGTYYAYQTPFLEKKGGYIPKTKRKYPLQAIYFLKKSKYFLNKAIINKDIIIRKLMSNFVQENKLSIKYDTKFLQNVVNLAKDSKAFHDLSFNLDEEKLLEEIKKDYF